MRGAGTFNSLFSDIATVPVKQEGKGRSSDLNALRDELLVYRFYYYGKYTPYRYERIIGTIAGEFFLSERRVIDIISQNSRQLRQLRENPPKIERLKEMYPHLVWRQIMPPPAPKATPIQW